MHGSRDVFNLDDLDATAGGRGRARAPSAAAPPRARCVSVLPTGAVLPVVDAVLPVVDAVQEGPGGPPAGTMARRNPMRSASVIRRGPPATGRTSPARPTSPNAMTPWGMARFDTELAMASATRADFPKKQKRGWSRPEVELFGKKFVRPAKDARSLTVSDSPQSTVVSLDVDQTGELFLTPEQALQGKLDRLQEM